MFNNYYSLTKSKSMLFSFFQGNDISKDWFDAAIIAENAPKKVLANKRFDNTLKGFKEWFKWLKTQSNNQVDKALICMEHTGLYTVPFCCFLEEKGLNYTLVPGLAIKRSLGITRGKDDKIDAVRITQYIRKNHDEIDLYTLPDTAIRALKALATLRKRLMKSKHSFEVSAKELLSFEQSSVADIVNAHTQELLKTLKEKIKQVDKQMVELIAQHPSLKRNYDLSVSVPGVGPQIAIYLLIYTQNFVAFTKFRKFATYCGIAPFPHGSGKNDKAPNKVSHLANKLIKALLTNGAQSAIRYCPEMKQYVVRQEAKGKNKYSIINVVRNKLISRVFAVVKRGSPYVPINNHYTLAKS